LTKTTLTAANVYASVTLPIYARSESNGRDHRVVKAKRTSEQRLVAKQLVRGACGFVAWGTFGPFDGAQGKGSMRFTITLTRIYSKRGKPLDDDNLRGSLKAVRDGVADALGFKDDSNPRLAWTYAEEPGTQYAVRVQIESKGEK
jgi:hypothetical protein